MPGTLVHLGASVICSHAGTATPTSVDPRVTVSAQPIVTLPIPYAIAGCPLTSPCVIGNWTFTATRVFASGVPVVLFDSQSVCAAPGTPMIVLVTQTRVIGT